MLVTDRASPRRSGYEIERSMEVVQRPRAVPHAAPRRGAVRWYKEVRLTGTAWQSHASRYVRCLPELSSRGNRVEDISQRRAESDSSGI